jgi:hypothetical protein
MPCQDKPAEVSIHFTKKALHKHAPSDTVTSKCTGRCKNCPNAKQRNKTATR